MLFHLFNDIVDFIQHPFKPLFSAVFFHIEQQEIQSYKMNQHYGIKPALIDD